MKRAICGYGLMMLMASAAAAQTVEQPAYHEYVRFMQQKKEIRTGKLSVFSYAQWVQYCRGEYVGTVKRVGGLFDRTCRKFVNPPTNDFAATGKVETAVIDQANEVAASQEPANWNTMSATEQARWFNELQRLGVCNSNPTAAGCLSPDAEAARQFNERQAQRASTQPSNWNFPTVQAELARRQRVMDQANQHATHISRCSDTGCVSVPNPNYKPFAPAPSYQSYVPAPPSSAAYSTTRCGRACGEPWTAADFAAADQEIARLQREIDRIDQRRSLYEAYVPATPAPIYTPRYRPAQPAYTPPPTSSTTSRIGRTTFYSGDVTGSATSLPPFQFYNFSNGARGTTTTIEPFQFHNFTDPRGKTTTGTTTEIGQFQFHNFSNGVSGSSTTIGGTTFHNFNNGKNCTTTTVGTTQFTNCY